MERILQHPWFLANLPPQAASMNATYLAMAPLLSQDWPQVGMHLCACVPTQSQALTCPRSPAPVPSPALTPRPCSKTRTHCSVAWRVGCRMSPQQSLWMWGAQVSPAPVSLCWLCRKELLLLGTNLDIKLMTRPWLSCGTSVPSARWYTRVGTGMPCSCCLVSTSASALALLGPGSGPTLRHGARPLSSTACRPVARAAPAAAGRRGPNLQPRQRLSRRGGGRPSTC